MMPGPPCFTTLMGCQPTILLIMTHSMNESINQSKPVTPTRRWDTPTDASAVMVAHRRLSSARRSNDDWSVHSLMLSFHDLRARPLRRLPSTESCSIIFGSVSWRQTWPNHDNFRRLTVDSRSCWGPARILTCCQTYSFLSCSLYNMPRCQASFCRICFQRPGCACPDQPSTSSSHTHTRTQKHRLDKRPIEYNFLWKN